ncbi:MAG TPA: response regulator [Pyrinomonadaceae bacterium]|nr:response regulator [Pyrinomonadaceae bacterium]
MGSNLLQSFLGQALQQIPAIRRSLTSAASGAEADLGTVRVQLNEIVSAALSLDQGEIAEFAAAAESEIVSASGIESGLSLLSKLEASLLRSMLEDESFSLDLDESEVTFAQTEEEPIAFVFDPSETAETSEAEIFAAEDPIEFETQTFASESEEDEFEVDAELLDIFAEEAEELLQSIDANLTNLANDRNDSNSLWEIRRNAHTFKGSAGIVGLKQLSEVAHRVEDLLDRLAETKCGANDQIIELLHRSTGCLKALVNGERSEELFRSISQLYYDFDSVLGSLNKVSATTAGVVTQTPEADVVIGEALNEHARTATPSTPLDQAILDRLFGATAGEAFVPKPAASRSVVRVSLDRLDDLIRITRDMLIGRSVFEQNLKSLERQIDDLHNTTRRLQTTSTKLEIDFEASMMGSGSSVTQRGNLTNPVGQSSFDELEFDKYTDFHQSTRELAETTSDTFSINASLDLLRGGFESVFDEQRRLIDELQEWLLHVRMVEFGSLSPRLQRAVRVTCDEEHKKAELRIVNESVEVDTQILDSLIEPLMHLLKNSVAHGIEDTDTRRLMGKPETGSIEIAVENDETHIVLRVSDDGRGISPEAVKEKAIALGQLTEAQATELSDEDAIELIFTQGLSTAEKLNLSAGRGVGMSIIKESIAAGRGSIAIESTSLKGTTFVVRMPLALAVTKVLLTKVSNRTYALPLRPITHIAELTEDLFAGIDGKKVDILGKKLPLYQLPAFLGNESVEPAGLLGRSALVYESADRSCAIAVEEVLTTEEVVIKPLARPLDKINGILGAAILGNGELVPIIDMHSLLRKKTHSTQTAVAPQPPREKTVSILIVDDSPSVRHMTSKVIKAAGWEPRTAKDGLDALEQLKACDDLPAIILSDIEMPRMDGYEFAASLQRSEKFSHIPVIMITSRTAEKHREKALESGVSQYLTKPYEDRELIDSIKILANLT